MHAVQATGLAEARCATRGTPATNVIDIYQTGPAAQANAPGLHQGHGYCCLLPVTYFACFFDALRSCGRSAPPMRLFLMR